MDHKFRYLIKIINLLGNILNTIPVNMHTVFAFVFEYAVYKPIIKHFCFYQESHMLFA